MSNELKLEDYLTKEKEANLDYFLKLNEAAQKNYLNLYLLYSNLLYKYLIPRLKLNTYDNMMTNARNHFEKVSVEDMDLYQYLAHDYLKYFYIRNNLYIERLSKEELEFLEQKYLSGNQELDSESLNFIQKTYPKVIAEKIGMDNIKINYGPDDYQFYQDSKALIIGVRFNEYYLKSGETEEEWDKKYDNREFELDNITFCLKKALENFEVKGNVVRYNDFSVKKLSNNTNNKKNS